MTALDLCCGKGGWARGLIDSGWRVVGVDLEDFSKDYPGRFIQANLLNWDGWQEIPNINLVVASPPCDEFSRWAMPWTRAKNPPEPSLALINRCRSIAQVLNVPFILENVRAAQKWLGKSAGNCGPFHLWGDVPAILPISRSKKKESYGSKQRAERAVIDYHLAIHIGKCFATEKA